MRALHARAGRRGGPALKRVALGLLLGAAALYALATWLSQAHPHVAWGYVAAFAEAAMVGAIADWFAVVALFRHPMGLPIPHTAIIPANKDRIGARLAGFIVDNFMSTPQVLAKLREFDAATRLAAWLSRRDSVEALASHLSGALRLMLSALDDQRVRDFIGRATHAGLMQIDMARLAGQVLDGITAGDRHQVLLDEVLGHVASAVEGEKVQQQITEAVAREVKALRYVGLDQVAARAATRRIVSAAARTLAEMAGEPTHPMRQRFDAFMRDFAERLKTDPDFRARGEEIRAGLMQHPALGDYVHGLWSRLLQWLDADIERQDSTIRERIVQVAASLGDWLAADEAMRRWINESLESAAPRAIERYREDIRRHITERVAQWDAREMSTELEKNIGRDLQFIRINGTLVGGLVGLAIHALTHALG